MSSMFKKKGGPAFKPKIPSARARPAAPPAAPSQPTNSTQNQPSIDSQARSTSQEVKNIASSATVTEESSVSESHEPSEPPRQNSPTQTPPEPVSETVPADTIPPTEKSPNDKPQTSGITSPITGGKVSEQTTIVDGWVASSELAPVETVSPQPKSSRDIIAPDASLNDTPSDPQTNTALVKEAEAPTIDSREDIEVTDSSATPEESSEATSLPSVERLPKPAPKPRTRRQVNKAIREESGESGEVDEGARPRKRQRKTTQEGTDGVLKQPRKQKTPSDESKQRRRARSVTPEDSESQVVDLQQLKMSDLTRDLHIGKKFSRHDELRERERRARLKLRLGESERDSSATPEPSAKIGSPAAPGTPKQDTSTPDTPAIPNTAASAPASGPQFRIVDGQIVIDQSSLAVDRHARAAAALGDMETVEENDFTRLITSNSFMNTSKLKGPNIWTDSETELFYRGLRMFGTDFEIISKMFPGKQRRNVKLKFNREERHCPRRINAALIGEKTVRMDIDEYKAATGATFESVESIEAEQRKRQEDFEAEQKRIADEQAEIMRKKREELFADDDEEVAKKKKGAKKGKQKIIFGLNGEPIGAES